MTLTFEVRGVCQTQGSMRAFVPRGWGRAVVTHNNPKTREWRQLVALEARRVAPASPWTGPLVMVVTFRLQRPKAHYGKCGVKSSAPIYPTGKPDTSKLLRALEDALTGVIYRDDCQLVQISVRKEYGPAGALVHVRQLGDDE